MILAHEDPAVLTLDVEGSATMMESPAVNEIASDRLSRGVRALRIDLRDCTAMDSTFSGTLLALKRQLDKLGGTLTLVSPSPRVLELLRQMGLEDFYAIEETDRVDGAGRGTEITPARPGVEELRRVVVDAHDELARVPGQAEHAFRDVVEELRREEQHTRAARTAERSPKDKKCPPEGRTSPADPAGIAPSHPVE